MEYTLIDFFLYVSLLTEHRTMVFHAKLHGTTDWFQIGKGVRQGGALSPCLFNLYVEYIMRNAR